MKSSDLNGIGRGKVPPQALDIEGVVLGAVMNEKEVLQDVLEVLHTPEMFYSEKHFRIYAAVTSLYNSGIQVDILTVSERLNITYPGEQWAYELMTLCNSVSTSAHTLTHACIIREKWERREIIKHFGNAVNELWAEDQSIDEILGSVDMGINSTIGNRDSGQTVHISTPVKEMLDSIAEMQNKPEGLTGVDTGLTELNKITNGWQNTDSIIIAARPSKGKTAFALNLAMSAAKDFIKNGKGVQIFSLEMSRKQLIQRITASEAKIALNSIKDGKMSEIEMAKLISTASLIAKSKIWIDDRAGISITQLSAKAKRAKRKHDVGLIIIDYLQLMKATLGKSGNREQEISTISRELKALAKELEIPIIALSQLNRDVEKRSNPKPGMGDLRESGSIEQDADIVIFIYHEPDAMNPNHFKNMISVAKHRNGELADIELEFVPVFQKWQDKNSDPFNQHETFKPYAGMPTIIQPTEDNPF